MSYASHLPPHLYDRLQLIVQSVSQFWQYKPHRHFTNHGSVLSEQVCQRVEQLAGRLGPNEKLTFDEHFVVCAASWLYEVGVQSPRLKPVLDIDYKLGEDLLPEQLQRIRQHKHLLTNHLLIESVNHNANDARIDFGLDRPPDDATWRIIEVCRWCSSEPLEQVPRERPVNGNRVRVRLLVALLRLADQLHINPARVNLDLLVRAPLPLEEIARWWCYHYTQVLPINEQGLISFHFSVPDTQQWLYRTLKAIFEPEFAYQRNITLRYLWNTHSLYLTHDPRADLHAQPAALRREVPSSLLPALRRVSLVEETDEETIMDPIPQRKLRVLFLAANPVDTPRLDLDEELRAVEQALRRAPFGKFFDIRPRVAVRFHELQYHLMWDKPDILHFSGHGSPTEGIMLLDDERRAHSVSAEILGELFGILRENQPCQCVVLNACYTAIQADAIGEHVECVVGTSNVIGDTAALRFAEAFYSALAFGQNVQTAFDLGNLQIDISHLKRKEALKLICKQSDSRSLTFIPASGRQS